MVKLLQEKRIVLQEILELTKKLTACIKAIQDVEVLARANTLLDERRAKMIEIDLLDKRIAALKQSGYAPAGEGEAVQITRERNQMREILQQIKELEIVNQVKLKAGIEKTMNDLKEVKDGRKSINAYVSGYGVGGNSTFDESR